MCMFSHAVWIMHECVYQCRTSEHSKVSNMSVTQVRKKKHRRETCTVATVTPSRKNRPVWTTQGNFSRNGFRTWLPRVSYGVYVAITWYTLLLQGVYVLFTGRLTLVLRMSHVHPTSSTGLRAFPTGHDINLHVRRKARSHSQICHIPKATIDTYKFAMFPRTVRLWHKLPGSVVRTANPATCTVKAPVFCTLNSAISNFQTWFVRTVMEVLKYCWM